MATTRLRSLSLPSDLVREAERLAKQEGRTKTEVLREALRRYGQEPVAWLEKKVRTGDRVHKRRLRVDLPDIARLGAPRWFDEEVADLGLAPTCAVAYRRTAFLGSGDHGPFRLTLDRALEGTACRVWDLAAAGDPRHALVPDRVVCELKFRDALPHLFKQLLAQLGRPVEDGEVGRVEVERRHEVGAAARGAAAFGGVGVAVRVGTQPRARPRFDARRDVLRDEELLLEGRRRDGDGVAVLPEERRREVAAHPA